MQSDFRTSTEYKSVKNARKQVQKEFNITYIPCSRLIIQQLIQKTAQSTINGHLSHCIVPPMFRPLQDVLKEVIYEGIQFYQTFRLKLISHSMF